MDDGGGIPPSGPARYKQVDSHIGQGAYGKVEKALDLLTGEHVAIKKVRLEVTCYDETSLKEAGYVITNGINHTVWREIKVMQEVNHPNVITVIQIPTFPAFKSYSYLMSSWKATS
eukprot:Gregarina_sp_Poly_1__6433@NODE_343_length_9409_cov_658_993470_g287_i0_p9_GENE_NODE_343_length_9409_cov_658_993470_g287_i0NODE_343_length_9409_cov_658_993470_g287_i0_p9_ORF_typecomplete_len116_score14_31Pkinase/PF00069_25/2_9e11Pkinase_Tyr/PF07714_17/1_1e06_NODE_343_length_9409_cov_658_993470_g287_i061676514